VTAVTGGAIVVVAGFARTRTSLSGGALSVRNAAEVAGAGEWRVEDESALPAGDASGLTHRIATEAVVGRALL
jgi:hypothetical protein